MGLLDFLMGSKSDPAESLPQNDAEKWTIGIYAMWSEYCGGSYQYFGGFEKNRSNASMARGVLSRDWAITNKQGVLDMVNYLIAEEHNSGDDAKKAAFNYGCAANIAARGYLGGHLTKEELMSESVKIAQIIRSHYHSWNEFTEQYIEGVGLESGIADKKPQFTEICSKLMAMPEGPYSVDWETAI